MLGRKLLKVVADPVSSKLYPTRQLALAESNWPDGDAVLEKDHCDIGVLNDAHRVTPAVQLS